MEDYQVFATFSFPWLIGTYKADSEDEAEALASDDILQAMESQQSYIASELNLDTVVVQRAPAVEEDSNLSAVLEEAEALPDDCPTPDEIVAEREARRPPQMEGE